MWVINPHSIAHTERFLFNATIIPVTRRFGHLAQMVPDQLMGLVKLVQQGHRKLRHRGFFIGLVTQQQVIIPTGSLPGHDKMRCKPSRRMRGHIITKSDKAK